jgi:hypothetical protein
MRVGGRVVVTLADGSTITDEIAVADVTLSRLDKRRV